MALDPKYIKASLGSVDELVLGSSRWEGAWQCSQARRMEYPA